jgi:hypothetical protein
MKDQQQAVLKELSAADLGPVTGFRFDERGRLMIGMRDDRGSLMRHRETREFTEARRGDIVERVTSVLQAHLPGEWVCQWSKDDWGYFANDGSGTILFFEQLSRPRGKG